MLSVLVALSGLCGLTWEVLWQHHASLAIGVSARGTAITLAATMGGLGLGSWVMGRFLEGQKARRPLLWYGAMEVVVGLGGLTLEPAFRWLGTIDAGLYRAAPGLANLGQVVGVAVLLLPQVLAMGATIPVFRLVASSTGLSLSVLYAINTGGAAIGVVTAAGLLIPRFGISMTGALIACLNMLVALGAATLARRQGLSAAVDEPPPARAAPDLGPLEQAGAVMVTGFVTLMLEVAWFRSLRAAFHSTTDAFALMLVSVLVPLATGAALASRLSATRATITLVLAAAGVLGTLATPIIERLDSLVPVTMHWYPTLAIRLGACLVLVGLPVLPLGTVLPLLLNQARTPRATGRLYALNTVAAVAGSLGSAWLALPTIGFARTAWLCGGLLVACGVWLVRPRGRRAIALATSGAVALGVAAFGESGVGRTRAQGRHLAGVSHRVLFSREAPDATVSVVLRQNRYRELVIDGFMTSIDAEYAHYLDWMGHAPMAFHAEPRRALVICFGTGRTAHAVTQEQQQGVDIVELSPAVLAASKFFPDSGVVLTDRHAHVIVMDGRAWLRRTQQMYDVITLEPMAPYFAGTNALYSLEFYRLASDRLRPGGVIAQWLPFHLVTPGDAASIVRTMQAVFPDTFLWIDPVDRTGIVLGRRGGMTAGPLLVRDDPSAGRNLDAAAIRHGLLLDTDGSRRYGAFGGIITDDNQLLAYGKGRRQMQDVNYSDRSQLVSLDILYRIARGERL